MIYNINPLILFKSNDMSIKQFKENINNILEKKLKDFEESCNLFDFDNLPQPPPLQRSYKATCLCGNRAYVYNKQREGGVCGDCEYRSKIAKL